LFPKYLSHTPWTCVCVCVMQRRWLSERSDGIKSGTHSIMNRYYCGRHVDIYKYIIWCCRYFAQNPQPKRIPIYSIFEHIIWSSFISATAAAEVPCVILSVATLHDIIYEFACAFSKSVRGRTYYVLYNMYTDS